MLFVTHREEIIGRKNEHSKVKAVRSPDQIV